MLVVLSKISKYNVDYKVFSYIRGGTTNVATGSHAVAYLVINQK
jgi:hypothetical protein